MFYSARTDRSGNSGQVAELFQGEPEKTAGFFLFDIKWKELYLFDISKTPPQLNKHLL